MSDEERPSLWDETADPEVWANLEVGGRRLTWKEATEHYRTGEARQMAFAQILHDLDRCEHGRHEDDDCSGCGGPSHGNPILPREVPDDRPPQVFMVPRPLHRQIGYALSGTPIVMPEGRHKYEPEAWIPGTRTR